jgi:hypothetical protein
LRVRLLRFLGASLDPRRERLWYLLFASGLVIRVVAILVIRSPMEVIFSDPGRHWNNGLQFLHPDPQGAIDPLVYQLYLFVVQKLTQKDPFWIGVITAALSVTYPLIWYGFARSVMRRRVNALRFATVLCWLPTHISIFGFFMNETLALPLVGLALWMTKLAIDRRTPLLYVAAASAWIVAVLTRSLIAPVGLACVVVSWLRLRHGRWWAGAVSGVVAAAWLAAAGVHAHGVLKRYTPFGGADGMSIYFASSAKDYAVTFKGIASYGFSSPSFYVSPWEPFGDFPTIREGAVSVMFDPDKHGADAKKAFHEQLEHNWKKLPRLVYENFVFLSFGHCWPTAGAQGDTADKICLWERWIWFPLTVLALVGSVVYVARRKAELVPLVVIGVLFTCYVLLQVAVLEGRYRKTFEPIVLLAPFWLLERRKDPSPT